MARPHRRDLKLERFWRAKVAACIASGLNICDFCWKYRLTEPSFHAWRWELAARDGTPVPKPTVTPKPITAARRSSASVPGPRPAAPTPRRVPPPAPKLSFVALRVVPDTTLELVLRSGHVVRVPPGYDANHLRAVVAALEAPSC